MSDNRQRAIKDGYIDPPTDLVCQRCGTQNIYVELYGVRDCEDEEGECTCGTSSNIHNDYCGLFPCVNGKLKDGNVCRLCEGTGKHYPFACIECDQNMFTFEVCTDAEMKAGRQIKKERLHVYNLAGVDETIVKERLKEKVPKVLVKLGLMEESE